MCSRVIFVRYKSIKMNTADTQLLERILSKLKSEEPNIHSKIFGSYNHSSSNGNDNVKLRQKTLITHCNEALRLLKVKRAHLDKKENPTIRAALVIDYLVRNVRNENNPKMYYRAIIPITALMKVVKLGRIKKKELEQMQILLEEYLKSTSIATKISNVGGDGRSRSNQQSTRNLRKRNADGIAVSTNSAAPSETAISPTGLIRDLCINLGPLIPDADFVFKYATKLFEALSNNASNKKSISSSSRRREQEMLRQDMSRVVECYEGACFYLAVKESEGANYNDVLKKKASAKVTLKNQQKKEEAKKKNSAGGGGGRKKDSPKKNNNDVQNDADADQDDENDTDDDRPMNEMDVVTAACLSERTFKEVLVEVKKHAKDIVTSLNDATGQKQPAKKPKNSASKDAAVSKRFGGQSVIVENDVNSRKSKRLPGNNAQFEQWKRKVLDETVTKMKGNGDKSMSREEAMRCAADEVIRRLQKSS